MKHLLETVTTLKNLGMTLLLSIFLTACDGRSGGGDTVLTAIEKITSYALDNSKPAPTVQDYLNAGLFHSFKITFSHCYKHL